jgi:hypothetical protein
VSDESKIIDAEFTDIDGVDKGGRRPLEKLADIAEDAAGPVGMFDEKAGAKVQQVSEVIRDVDALIEEARPIARKAGGTFEKMLKTIGLDDFNERDVMKR